MKKMSILFCFLCLTFLVMAQTREIRGRITDSQGNGVSGATVSVKGSTVATQTGGDGSFTLTVPQNAGILVISSVGFANQEVNIVGKTTLNLSLSQQSRQLDEVVIVGYGQQQRSRVTGSVSTLRSSEIENIPLPSIDQILQGKIAGLQSVAPTGQPGSLQQVRIRGIGSISAGSAPLYVVDGIPVNHGDFTNNTNSASALAGINPTDIESVTVLKDAASTSIYGSRGANGVILITTKKGRSGKPVFKLNTEYGVGSIAFLPENGRPLNRAESEELITEGLVNAGATPAETSQILDVLGFNSLANYDWLDLVSRNSKTRQLNLSTSGGDANTQYYFSGGYFDQQAAFIGSDFKRYSAAFNLRQKLGSRVTFTPNVNVSYSNQMGESESSAFRNPYFAGLALLPTAEAFNADGSPNYDPNVFNQLHNPLAVAAFDQHRNNTFKALGGLDLQVQILRNLKFGSKYGIDFFNIEERSYYNPFFGDFSPGGLLFASNVRAFNWIWTNTLDYNFRLDNMGLNGNVKLGYEAQKSNLYDQNSTGEGVPLTTLIPYPPAATPTDVSFNGSDYSFVSQFVNADLGYQNRFIVSGTFRRDGSSRFGPLNQYANFWSVGASWNMHNEKFLQSLSFISQLKLRASYGTNGNAEIGDYAWRPLVYFGSGNNYAGIPGAAPTATSVGNENLTWEKNEPLNIGLDAGFLNNRLTVGIDVYKRKTSSLLLDVPLSRTSGFTEAIDNVGAMENKGIELTVGGVLVNSENFRWNASFNFAMNRNKITSLYQDRSFRDGVFIRQVGEDFQSIFTRLWAGVDPANGDALWYKDETKAETTNDFSQAQRAIIGSASPKGFGGFSTDLSFKNFTLDAQINYQYGNIVNDFWGFLLYSDGAYATLNQNRTALRRWQNPGDITDVPKFVFNNASGSNAESSRWYYKGDYFRVRNISLTYNLPSSLLHRAKIGSAQVYVRGTNLFTKAFDKNITIDPEQRISGQSDLNFLPQKVISFGLNLSL